MEEKIMNEEIMEVVEDFTPCTGSSVGGKFVKGAVVAGLIFGGYKLIKKLRSKKKETEYVEVDGDDENVIDAEEVEKLNKKLN